MRPRETTQAIELSRLEILARAAAPTEAGVYAPATDGQLHAAYDQYAASLPSGISRCPYPGADRGGAAQDLIAKLQTGVSFAKLAMSESQDGSKDKEGDLGLIAPGKLPPVFTDAIRALKPGEFHAKPVHTAYGWHINQVDRVTVCRCVTVRASPGATRGQSAAGALPGIPGGVPDAGQ